MADLPDDAIVPVNKPISFSTYDLVRIFKRETGFPHKIGHGGTLDPFATGVVLLLLGKATSRFEEIRTWEKVYLAGIRLGAVSSTQDIAGQIETAERCDHGSINRSSISNILERFVGSFVQKVPAYSAAKHEGVPMYKLAAKGVAVAKSKTVTIMSIEIVNLKWPLLSIRVRCTGGVYIRQLAADIGEALDLGGFLYFLEREKIGEYTLKDCASISEFRTKYASV
ncbi:MAG TPA: tRNA pseudouridine(55) synthase TruB [bacterium]